MRPLRARTAIRVLLAVVVPLGAVGVVPRADAHDPEATGGLHLSFGDERVAWPSWQPGSRVSDLWRMHGARLRAVGVDATWLWDGSRWIGYAVDRRERTVPGSIDFELSASSELHYSSGSPATRAQVRIDPAAVQQGPLAGILQDRHILGDPHAPVVIVDYSDFL